MRNALRSLLVAPLLVAFVAKGQTSNDLVKSLNTLLHTNASVELIEALRTAPQSAEVMVWLRQRANEGHVIAQFSLANRLAGIDRRQAFKWQVLANISENLDRNQCKDQSKSAKVARLTSGFSISASAIEVMDYAEAVDDAMEVAARQGIGKKSRQSVLWVCAPGEQASENEVLTPDPAGSEQRWSNWEQWYAENRNNAKEIRLNAKLNPDGYKTWQLGSKFWERKINADLFNYFSAVWVSDDVLLFGGYLNVDDIRSPSRYDPIYRWDLSRNEVAQYAGSGFGLCYFKGFISYFTVHDGRTFYWEGQLGREKESVLSTQAALEVAPGRVKSHARFQCRRYTDSASPHSYPTWTLDSGGKLRREGNAAEQNRSSAIYFPEGTEKGITFDPFEGLRTSGRGYGTVFPPRYSEYLNASWVTVTGARAFDPTPVWVLWKDGRVERQELPAGPWSSSINSPVKNGWLALTSSGVYLLSKGSQVKLLSGDARAVRVSPNGCRVAVVTSLGQGRGTPMWVFDICEKGPTQ